MPLVKLVLLVVTCVRPLLPVKDAKMNSSLLILSVPAVMFLQTPDVTNVTLLHVLIVHLTRV